MILIKNCFHIESPDVADGGRGWDIAVADTTITRIAPDITPEEVGGKGRPPTMWRSSTPPGWLLFPDSSTPTTISSRP